MEALSKGHYSYSQLHSVFDDVIDLLKAVMDLQWSHV